MSTSNTIKIGISESKNTYVVPNIAARDALTTMVSGDEAYVQDATADPTVASGAAQYVFAASTWNKVSELDNVDLSIDLAFTPNPGNGVVTNSVGADATIPVVDNTNAGLMSPADKTKLDNIEAEAKDDQELSDGEIFVGNASNVATSVAMTGEASINNTGEVTVVSKIKDWEASTPVQEGELRLAVLAGAELTIRSNSDRTTGAALNVAELGGWDYVSQNNIADFVQSTPYIEGQLMTYEGELYIRTARSESGATINFDPDKRKLTKGGAVRPFVGGADFEEGEISYFEPGSGEKVYIRSLTTHTAEASMDATEVARWEYFGQSHVEGWLPSVPRWKGMLVFGGGCTLIALSTGMNDPFFSGPTTSHYAIHSQTGFTGWSGSTAFFKDQQIRAGLGGVTNVTLRSNSSRSSGSALNVTELTNWTLVHQPDVPEWVGETFYIEGFKVTYQGSLLQRKTTGASQATFTDSEESSWDILAYGFRENGLVINNVTDAGPGTYKLYAPTSDCTFQLPDIASDNAEGLRILMNWGDNGNGNNILIAPQPTDKINGGVAGEPFYLSNYPVGTMVVVQSTAIDNWSTQVLGQTSEDDQLSWKHFSWDSQAGSSASPFNFTTQAGSDQQGKITHVANSGEVTFKKGRYMLNASLTFKASGTGSVTIDVVNGSIPGRAYDAELDQLYVQSGGQPANAHDRTRMFVIDVTEDGHTFGLERVAVSGNGDSSGEIMVFELPTAESLTAGAVKATNIGSANFRQKTSQNCVGGDQMNFAEEELSNSSDGAIVKTANNAVTLKAGHRFKIQTKQAIRNSNPSNAQLGIDVRINGVSLNLDGNEGLTFTMASGAQYSTSSLLTRYLEASTTDRTLTIHANNISTNVDGVTAMTTIDVMPTHAAVLPDSVEVRPLGRAFINYTGQTGFFPNTGLATAPIGDSSNFITNTSRFSFDATAHEITIQPGSRVRLRAGGGRFDTTNGLCYFAWAIPGQTQAYDPVGALSQHGAAFGRNQSTAGEQEVDAILEFTPISAVTLRIYVFNQNNGYRFNETRGYVTIEEIPEYNVVHSNYVDHYSLTETLTNKTWIDGRPIYRKVIPIPNLTAGQDLLVATGITGATVNARPVGLEGFVPNSNLGSHWWPINTGSGGVGATSVRAIPQADLSGIFFATEADVDFTGDGFFVMEYVK